MPEAATEKAPEQQQEVKATEATKEAPAAKDSKGFNFEEWLKTQPKEAQEALQSNERGLKSALDKTRAEAEAAQKELKKAERERQLAEDQKLRDENRWKELAEANEKRAKELAARLEAEEWTKTTRSKLREVGLTDFEDLLLASRETPDEVAATGAKLREIIDARVEAEILKRLDTGKRPASQGTQPAKQIKDMSPEEWAAYKKANGIH